MNKGFTLVELLVSISILAILTILAIPTLRAFQSKNVTSQYLQYKKTIETSAKLYNDSYSDDIFGSATDGCEKLSLTELMNKKLAKNIAVKDVDCNLSNKDSYVVVRKFNSEYKYEGYLYCENSSHKKVYSNMDEYKNDCVGNDGIPKIVVDKDKTSDESMTSKEKTIVLKLLDDYGFVANQEFKYIWTTSNTAPTDYNSYKTYKFNNSFIKTDGKVVELKTKSISNNNINKNDKYWIHIKPIRIQNIINNHLTEVQSFGPFRFDDKAPSCEDIKVTPNISSGKSSKDVYFNFDYSELEDLNEFIFKVSYDNGTTWENTVISKDKTRFEIEKDGKIKYQIINIKDFAGNKSGNCTTKGPFIRDTKKPTCNIKLSGTKGDNDWYKEKNVTVTLEGTDSISEVTSKGLIKSNKVTYNGETTKTQGDTKEVTWYGYIQDAAGNENSCNKTFKVDKTAPTISVKLTSNNRVVPNNAVSNHDITRTISATDELSGISSYSSFNNKSKYTLKEDKKITEKIYVKDAAGNKSEVISRTYTKNSNTKCGEIIIPEDKDLINIRNEPDWGKEGKKWCAQGFDDTLNRTCSAFAQFVGKGQITHSDETGTYKNNPNDKWNPMVVCENKSNLETVTGIKINAILNKNIYCYRSVDDEGVIQIKNGVTTHVKFVKIKLLVEDNGVINPNLVNFETHKKMKSTKEFTLSNDKIDIVKEGKKKYVYAYMSGQILGLKCG